jgi:uncharacterized protein (DUF1330 family)
MAAYLVAHVRTTDPAKMEAYRREVVPAVEKFGGRYLVRGGEVEALEGTYDGRRLVVIEFPDLETVQAFYDSPDYQAAKALREGGGQMDMWAVPGYQP